MNKTEDQRKTQPFVFLTMRAGLDYVVGALPEVGDSFPDKGERSQRPCWKCRKAETSIPVAPPGEGDAWVSQVICSSNVCQ